MGGRYLVSGAQLGTLVTLCRIDQEKANKLLNDIIETQLIYESNNQLDKDIVKFKKML